MREKLKTLTLVALKEMGKNAGIKGYSTMNKETLIDALVQTSGGSQDSINVEEEAPKKRGRKPAKAKEAEAEVQEKTYDDVATKSIQDEVREISERPIRQENQARKSPRGRIVNVQDRNNLDRNVQDRNNQDRNNQDRNNQDRNNQDRSYQSRNPQDGQSQTDRNGYTPKKNVVYTNNNSNSNKDELDEKERKELDSGITVSGILEVMPDGFGFIRCDNYMPGENDVYVAPSQIRRFNLKTGDIISGNLRVRNQGEKFPALLYLTKVNDRNPEEAIKRMNFENMTPIFPNERIMLEPGCNSVAMRMMDIIAPIGKGQRGMIVAPPKAGKTTLLKQIAQSVTKAHPEIHLIILLIDERPEEVTDIKESITAKNVEVIHSTFDELPDHHKRVSEMAIERARRLVELHEDVMILLDSITRLARAYNITVTASGRTLSGGLDPAALHMPKRFFGAARNMREGGSLTILATALVDTGSKMDDVVYEEFKGTGNMEMVLNRKLQEKRVFPAIDLQKSGTRRDDLLLSKEEMTATDIIHRAVNGARSEEAVERLIDTFAHTKSNRDFISYVKKTRF